MRIRTPLALAFVWFFNPSFSLRLDHRNLNVSLLDCYDYIIVGGGVSGLVVANRLTEDPDVTVLVLESGDLDQDEDFITYPFEDGAGLGTMYDWNLWTAPQVYLDGDPCPYDLGRGVGGGSIINGMCWTRGGKADFDAWVAVGNSGWGWSDLLPYFMKTENYTDDVNASFTRKLYIRPNTSIHGSDGYIHVSYPQYFYNQSQLFLDGLQQLGIPILTDPNNGTAAGGMLIPDSINPDNQTRSYARTGYFNGFIDTRPNFHVATGQLVIHLLLDTRTVIQRDYPEGLWVNGVEFITDGSLTIHNVTCSREVILAAGAVHSPQILELSGIGPADVLSKFDIRVVMDLPGVGNNFQDHPLLDAFYYIPNASYLTKSMILSNPGLLNETVQEYFENKSGPYTAGSMINTVAFPSLPSISSNWTNMMQDASSQDATQYLVSGLDPTIIAGYEAQKTILVDLLSSTDVGSYELLNDNLGLLAVSVMHPFSRGSVHILSINPLQQPLIDPRYCANPLDCQILVEALLFNNKLVDTSSMKLVQPTPYSPFFQNATVETLMPVIRSGIRTEFHGTGSTSMMPRDLGGVVDTHLRVYGTKNLHIVDAGIIPLVPAAHLQAPVYAIAEKAADIIKADNAGLIPQGCGPNSVFAHAGPVLSNISSNVSNVLKSVPLISNFPQFLNSSFLGLFNGTSTVASAATANFSGGLFDPEKIALLGQGTLSMAEPTGNPIGALASMLMTSSPTSAVSNSTRFSIIR